MTCSSVLMMLCHADVASLRSIMYKVHASAYMIPICTGEIP